MTPRAGASPLPRAFTPGAAGAIAAITSVGIGISLGAPLLALTLEARGVDTSTIGLLSTAYGLAMISVTPLIARYADRLPFLRLLVGALALSSGVFLLFPSTESLILWALFYFLSGAAIATAFSLSEAWINAVTPDSRRGLVMGVYATFLSMGFAAGPTILSLTGLGLLPFGIASATMGGAALAVLAFHRHVPDLEGSAGISLWRYVSLAPIATVGVFVFALAETGGFTFMPLYGKRLGFDERLYALLPAIMTLGNVLLQIPLGILSDRVNRRALLLLCGAAGLLGAVLMPFASGDAASFVPLLFVWGGAIGGLYTVGLAHLGERFSGASIAGANAAFVFCYALGALVSPAPIGAAMDAHPDGLPLTLAAAFAMYLLLAATITLRRAST